MNNKISIHEYSNEYQNDVLDLILQIQQIEFQVPITREDQPDLVDVENIYQIGSGNFWMAIYKGNVVGTIALLDIGCEQLALRKMFVAKEYRGKDWNTAYLLLKKAIIWAEQKNVNVIYLGTTEKFKAAHRFYERNKFQEISMEDLPSNFPKVHVDNKFYKLNIR